MKRKISIGLIILLSASLVACNGTSSAQVPVTSATQPATPQAAQTTPTAAGLRSQTQTTPTTAPPSNSSASSTTTNTTLVDTTLAKRLTNTCDLLNSQDLASLLTTGELVKEPLKAASVAQPIFANQKAAANEITCIFYEFHNPGKADEELIQVTYWIDLPASNVSQTDWQSAWTQADQNGQAFSGLDAPAFRSNEGWLTFKQDGAYFTVEMADTHRSADQITTWIQQVAADMLKNLANLPGAS